MKVIIDDKICQELGIDVPTALLLASIYYNSFERTNIYKACIDGFLTYNNTESTTDCTKFALTYEGGKAIESIMLNSEIPSDKNEDRFTLLANKLREIFPKGKKPGTAYQWRDSTNNIALRLKAVVKKYGVNFTDEQAIQATKKYVQSFNGNYTYMQLLKYFIMKNNMMDRVDDTSQLLSYIENLNDADAEEYSNMELV